MKKKRGEQEGKEREGGDEGKSFQVPINIHKHMNTKFLSLSAHHRSVGITKGKNNTTGLS